MWSIWPEAFAIQGECNPRHERRMCNPNRGSKVPWSMQDEMDSLHENHTYELVELPKGKRELRNKWVYKLKPGDGRNPPRYKARIVVKGF